MFHRQTLLRGVRERQRSPLIIRSVRILNIEKPRVLQIKGEFSFNDLRFIVTVYYIICDDVLITPNLLHKWLLEGLQALLDLGHLVVP